MKITTPHGFTRLDMAVLVAAVGVACGLGVLLPELTRPKAPHCRINCVGNLKQIGLAARMYANDHNDQFPFQISTNLDGTLERTNATDAYLHFALMSDYLVSPKVLKCPADNNRTQATSFAFFGNANLSYFVGLDADEAKPQSILSGDRNIVGGGTTHLRGWGAETATMRAGWTNGLHEGHGNIALGDGSAQQVNASALRKQIFAALQSTQTQVRLLIPPP